MTHNTYHFTIFVRDVIFGDTLEDTLYNAGLDDTLLCTVDDLVYLEFDREAMNAKTAISSAFADLNRAGFFDLVLQEKGVSSLAELAKRLNLSRTTLSNYANDKRGGRFSQALFWRAIRLCLIPLARCRQMALCPKQTTPKRL